MSVRIIRQGLSDSRTDTDFLRVSTSSDPEDDTVTLATIERVVERSGPRARPGPARHVKTLVMAQPMSFDDALGFATCYAKRKKIPIIYTDPD